MMSTDRKLTIGGYAQIDYNQPMNRETYNNGTLDIHRLVMLFGYKFNNRVQFITEIEYEHVSEVYIEQAFVDYKINNYMNLRAGLMLIPMGIVNEYHEPPTYMGVERPGLDNYIVPTTWREMGIGLTGIIPNANLRYQAYVVNGFASYKGSPGAPTLRGSDALRRGRQKGAESFMSSPNFSAKVEYYGLKGLNLGIARPKENYNKSAGYTQTEIDGFDGFIRHGLVDTFRHMHPTEVKYSWWSYRAGARENNIGWRIDYFLVSSTLANNLRDAFILNEFGGSDHCPVGVIL